jgi:hypothetical protein
VAEDHLREGGRRLPVLVVDRLLDLLRDLTNQRSLLSLKWIDHGIAPRHKLLLSLDHSVFLVF